MKVSQFLILRYSVLLLSTLAPDTQTQNPVSLSFQDCARLETTNKLQAATKDQGHSLRSASQVIPEQANPPFSGQPILGRISVEAIFRGQSKVRVKHRM